MKKWIPLIVHILGWSMLLAGNTKEIYDSHDPVIINAIAKAGISPFLYCLVFNFLYTIVFLVGFYGTWFFIGPLLIPQKKYLKALLLLVIVLGAMVITRWVVEFKILNRYLFFDNYFNRPVQPWYYIRNCIVYSYRYCLLALVIYFILASNRIDRDKKEREKERMRAELTFLRTQINPHFLFNSINDIYALTYKKDDKAPEALLKLSGILRYMIYDGAGEKVLLQNELSYLQNYIELQQIGAKGGLYINFIIYGEVNRQLIAPLLLIPFMENIFKHGLLNDPLNPAAFSIKVQTNQIILDCKNKIMIQQKDQTGGIGLNNVKRRLELLYPGKYVLKVDERDNWFICSLQLSL